MKILGNWLKNNGVEGKKIEEYLELIKICISKVYFKFGGKYYEQKLGLVMGNPLSIFG